jgi:hypothetical protein
VRQTALRTAQVHDPRHRQRPPTQADGRQNSQPGAEPSVKEDSAWLEPEGQENRGEETDARQKDAGRQQQLRPQLQPRFWARVAVDGRGAGA